MFLSQNSQRAITILLVGFLCGIAVTELIGEGTSTLLLIFVLGAGIGLTAFIWKSRSMIFVGALILLIGMFAGSLRMVPVVNQVENYSLDGRDATLTGYIFREPEQGDSSQQIVLAVEDVSISVSEDTYPEHVIIFAPRHPIFSYGDVLQISGVLKRPGSFTTDTGRVFDYAAYLAKDDIDYQIFFPDITKIPEVRGNSIKRALFDIKDAYLSNIKERIPDPHAALAGGITVGVEEALGDELEREFRKTGIIHIVVLSGYNVTIIAEAFLRIFAFLPLATGLASASVAIILFALLTGGSATIVRASIMAILAIIGRATGRRYAITRALIIAAVFMTVLNPSILLHDPSFQLSFLATLGLIHISPYFEDKLSWLTDKFQIRTLVSATLGAQLMVLPLLLWMIGELSLVSVPVNVLVLPFIPLAMLATFLVAVVEWVVPFLWLPFGAFAYGLLEYVLTVVHWFAELPFASIIVPQFNFVLVVVVYVLIGWWVYKKAHHTEVRRA